MNCICALILQQQTIKRTYQNRCRFHHRLDVRSLSYIRKLTFSNDRNVGYTLSSAKRHWWIIEGAANWVTNHRKLRGGIARNVLSNTIMIPDYTNVTKGNKRFAKYPHSLRRLVLNAACRSIARGQNKALSCPEVRLETCTVFKATNITPKEHACGHQSLQYQQINPGPIAKPLLPSLNLQHLPCNVVGLLSKSSFLTSYFT